MQMVDILKEVLRSSSDEEVDDSDADKDYVAGDEEESSDDGETFSKVPSSSKGATMKKVVMKKKGITAASKKATGDNQVTACEATGDKEAAADDVVAGCSNAAGDSPSEKTVKKVIFSADPPQGEVRIYMDPPEEIGLGDTDVDRDDDDDPDGAATLLPQRIQRAGAQKRIKKKSAAGNRLETVSSDDEEDDVPVVNLGQWSKTDSGLVGSKVPPYIKPLMDMEQEEWVEQLQDGSAFDYYRVFQSPSYVQNVIEQSKLYGTQTHQEKARESMTENTYR
jgi:hypothetical protein